MKLNANGIEINYEIEGDGPVVTYSHSLACDLSMWDEQARALRGRYRVLRYDTRGHGRTSAPAGAYTLDMLAADARALLEALGIAQTHFVGLSMGGMIGQVLTLAHPSLVASLVLCDTTSRYPAAAAPIWDERIRTVEAQGMEAMVEPTLSRWFTGPFRARRADVTGRVAELIRRTPPAGYIGCCRALPKIDVTDRRCEVRCPALVSVGEDDPGTPVEMARDIHRALPGAELAILRSASHLSNLEQPGEFTRVLAGGNNEQKNLNLVHKICDILDDIAPPIEVPQLREQGLKNYKELIRFVTDRPGHDRRYAIDSAKIRRELGWQAEVGFEAGLHRTIEWYLQNPEWVDQVSSGSYGEWIKKNYAWREAKESKRRESFLQAAKVRAFIR